MAYYNIYTLQGVTLVGQLINSPIAVVMFQIPIKKYDSDHYEGMNHIKCLCYYIINYWISVLFTIYTSCDLTEGFTHWGQYMYDVIACVVRSGYVFLVHWCLENGDKTAWIIGVRVMMLNATFNNILAISWLSGGGNCGTRKKIPTFRNPLTNLIT